MTMCASLMRLPLSHHRCQALVRVVAAALNASKALASRALFDLPAAAATRGLARSLASKQMLLGNAMCALYYSVKVWMGGSLVVANSRRASGRICISVCRRVYFSSAPYSYIDPFASTTGQIGPPATLKP